MLTQPNGNLSRYRDFVDVVSRLMSIGVVKKKYAHTNILFIFTFKKNYLVLIMSTCKNLFLFQFIFWWNKLGAYSCFNGIWMFRCYNVHEPSNRAKHPGLRSSVFERENIGMDYKTRGMGKHLLLLITYMKYYMLRCSL